METRTTNYIVEKLCLVTHFGLDFSIAKPNPQTHYCDSNPTRLINEFFFTPNLPHQALMGPSRHAQPSPKSETQISIYDFPAQNYKCKHKSKSKHKHKHKHKNQISDL